MTKAERGTWPSELYLQLKVGNSHLESGRNGTGIFKDRRFSAGCLMAQAVVSVMLRDRHLLLSPRDDERGAPEKGKVESADVRWIEIANVLQARKLNGNENR